MKKQQLEESENEFDVDEPDEIQNNHSDDDWTPEVEETSGRRQSSRLRNSSTKRFTEMTSSEEDLSDDDDDDDSEGDFRRRRSRQRKTGGRMPKRQKVTSTTNENSDSQQGDGEAKSNTNSDSEPSSTTVTRVVKVGKEFSSGAFVVSKTDFTSEGHPTLWKIDGKALLQKYIPFEQDGKTFYKNTSVYSGWSMNNKDQYYPANVVFKQHNRKEHIVEFKRDLVKAEPEETPEEPVEPAN